MQFSEVGRVLLQASLLATLAACGGGGGGGSTGTSGGGTGSNGNADGGWLTFSPSPLQASTYEDEAASVTVIATATRQFSNPFNVAIIDSKGVIQPQAVIRPMGPTQYQAHIATAVHLPAGNHSTNLQVRVCEDDPLVCKLPLPGSPWSLPLAVTVKTRTEAAARLTFTPASAAIEVYPGETATFRIDGKWAPDVKTSFFNVTTTGPADLLKLPLSEPGDIPGGFRASFTTRPLTTPGLYTGTITVGVCQDIILPCPNFVSGSPWKIPFTIKVKPSINLVALQPLPHVSPWSNERGNAAHTAYVPATFDPAHFTRRFKLAGTGFTASQSLANDKGRVFAVRHGGVNSSELVAIDEASGTYACAFPWVT